MKVDFQYGKSGLIFNIPEKYENVTILEPKEDIGLKDPINEIYNSFQKPMSSKPLKLLLQRRKEGEIVIIVEDHTRPLKSKSIIDALIKIFSELNINDNEVKILVATGLHRSSTPDELERMLGIDIINRFDIIFHDANNKMDLDNIGENKFGNQIYLNSLYVNAGFRIVTGYVEPHFFAGYSGGRKSLIPGIAGKETILNNHSAKNCDNENARFGFLKGNPIHEDASEAVKMAKPDFCINTIINSTHEITKVASGNITSVHNYLVQIQQKKCFSEIDKKFDIILCGNGGYPLDLNLYQSVKSMAIGEIAVKKGGIIISINECSDKVGQESFKVLINSGKTPEVIYSEALKGNIDVPDIWEIQILSRILISNEIIIVSSMKADELGNIGLKHAETVEKAFNIALERLNLPENEISILILPKGPLILPRYKNI